MSKKRGGKSDQDDLDDILGDLLADDDDLPKKKPGKKAGATGRGQSPGGRARAGKSGGKDDDFYSSLAAGAKEESDVSDADPAEMAKSLADMDDLDAALFGGKKSPGPAARSPAPGKTPPTKAVNKPAGKPGGKKEIDFDDDDPLAGLLSDDEDSKPLKSSLKKPLVTKEDPFGSGRPDSSDRPPTGPAKNDDDTDSVGSRRLEIDRPPTRSGTSSGTPDGTKPSGRRQKKDDDIMFDDDDVLGGMGFDDSPRSNKPSSGAKSDGDGEKKGRSILDDLLGKDSVAKHLERPGSREKKEFAFDKLLKSSAQKKEKEEPKEDDFQFGGYMPSAAAESRPSSTARSVRFEDDGLFGDRPASRGSSAGRRRGAASLFEDMVQKDDRDWLDMASGTTSSTATKKDADRPRSEGSIVRKPTEKPGTANSAVSEPVDWLGLSRLGSPDATRPPPAAPVEQKTEKVKDPSDFLGHNRDTKDHTDKGNNEDDDWLGLSGSRRAGQTQRRSTTPDKVEDWLGIKRGDQSKEPSDRTLGRQQSTEQKDDWLLGGVKETKTTSADDWLGMNDTVDSKQSSGADYLGLGEDVDLSSIPSKPHQTDRNSKTKDIFTTPKRDPGASLPWESGRRGRGTSVQTPPSTGPVKRQSSALESPMGGGGGGGAAQHGSVSNVEQEQTPPLAEPWQQPQISQPTVTQPTQPTSITLQIPDPVVTTTSGGSGLSSALAAPFGGVSMGVSPLQQQLEQQQKAAAAMAQQQELQQQEMLKQQQAIAQQQQQQQAELQRQLVEQQNRMQQEQQQRLQALQDAQQKLLQQQVMAPMSAPMPQMSSVSFGGLPSLGMPGFGGGGFGVEAMDSMIKKLELEKRHLEIILETTRQQHQEEIKLMEDSYKKRTDLLDETFGKRESRLKEENEFLASRSAEREKQFEQEKRDLMAAHSRQYEEWQQQKQKDLDRMRDIHRQELDKLRQEQEEALTRLKKAKDQEVDTLANKHEHTRSLQDVMQQVSATAVGLGNLEHQIRGQHVISLDKRESAAKAMDQQLRGLKEKLERQQHETEVERAQLQGLVSKLEMQLTDQARAAEEDKWAIKQEESRLQTMQTTLDQDRRQMMEQLNKDRLLLQKSKDQLLDEQKSILSQLYEERRALAEERAQFSLSQKLKQDQDQRDSLKNVKTEAELGSSVKALNDERERLHKQAANVRQDEHKLAVEHSQLEEEQQKLKLEKERLEHIALKVKQRSQDIEEMCMSAAQAREEGASALQDARRLEAEQSSRIQNIQAQLSVLRAKEKQIAGERLSLAREKQAVEHKRGGSNYCASCRTPVKDHNNQVISPQGQVIPNMSAAAMGLLNALSPNPHAKMDTLDSVSNAIRLDRSVRMWKISADKDKAFLEDQTFFLESIKQNPYQEGHLLN